MELNEFNIMLEMEIAIWDYESSKRIIAKQFNEEWSAETECAFISWFLEDDSRVHWADGVADYCRTYMNWKGIK